MMETISTPAAISKVTSELTAPSTSFVTFPFNTLRALIFMGAGLFQTVRGIAIGLRFGWLGPKRSILTLLSRTRQATCRSEGHLVLTAVRAIPPGDGPVLQFAACAVPAGIEVEAAPARSPAFFSLACQSRKEVVFLISTVVRGQGFGSQRRARPSYKPRQATTSMRRRRTSIDRCPD